MNKNNFIILIFVSFFACSSSESSGTGELNKYNFSSPIQFSITNRLNEISGLTRSSDNNIFAINDEEGVIYKLDPKDGSIHKWFSLGKWSVEADFEGIAYAENYFYAITSNGTLYKFPEGDAKKSVTYEVIRLPFSSKFDIEGLYYDEELKGLLLVCKDYSGKNFKGERAVYFYSLDKNEIQREPLFTISLKKLKKDFNIKDFYPSGITKHPISKSYFIISARGNNVIVEVDKSGRIINVHELKDSLHRQPEGITILNDNILIISDEAAGKKPTITKYSYSKD